jgi:hypothetical protein
MRLTQFRVQNYRSVRSTDWIDAASMTALVGQNEAGKSNLCEALYILNPMLSAKYNVDEDWPVDDWGNKDASGLVCEARFAITDSTEQLTFLKAVDLLWSPVAPSVAPDTATKPIPQPANTFTKDELPNVIAVRVVKNYANTRAFFLESVSQNENDKVPLDLAKAEIWAAGNLPKCVYISEYEFPGSRIELNELAQRANGKEWSTLSRDDQTILVVLELAKIDINAFIARGQTPEGRTIRSFDKRQASAYLTSQFAKLWGQKKIRFDIDIDATTLNVFVEDEGVGMPVRLDKRSTGFRWYVAFAWKFTHATKGAYKNTILILEEPGVHLHYDGHRDLLGVLSGLAETNTVIYTTHVATMLDPGYPERVRIIETHNHHTRVVPGVVTHQRVPMMLIEARLGLSPSLGGLLGVRQTLIVEGGDEALILQKLSGLLGRNGEEALSDRIYLWPALGASKTPMYAGFLVGNKFDGGVLLDSDAEGLKARTKIQELYLTTLAGEQKFRVLMLKEAAGIPKNEPAIEDIFPDGFYLECVNTAYRYTIKAEDLPADGSDQITKRVEAVLMSRYGHKELDKRRVMAEMLRRFDDWKSVADLPGDTVANARKLIAKINAVFA